MPMDYIHMHMVIAVFGYSIAMVIVDTAASCLFTSVGAPG